MKKILLIIILLCLYGSISYAACPGTPADCYTVNSAYDWTTIDASQDAIQTTINQVPDVSTVYTIHVPAGSATWTSRVSTDYCSASPVCINNRNIYLIGAGGLTTDITDNDNSANAYNATIYVSPATRANFRISGFYFHSAQASKTKSVININKIVNPGTQVGGTASAGFRVDNNTFSYSNSSGISRSINVYGWVYGVVDSNTFIPANNNGAVCMAVSEDRGDAGTDETNQPGSLSWSAGAALSSANAVYFENNTVTRTSNCYAECVDAGSGARYVARYNTINNTYMGSHGPGTSSNRGHVQMEIYRNHFIAEESNNVQINLTGGTGVVYGNVFSGSNPNANPIMISDYRTGTCANCSGTAYGQWHHPCDGTQTLVDQGNAEAYGWPCGDQLGVQGTLLSQTSAPFYMWDNGVNPTFNPEWSGITHPQAKPEDHIQLNRDYYLSAKPGYAPYSCPHPLTGLTGACLGGAGIGYYNVIGSKAVLAPNKGKATIGPNKGHIKTSP